MRNMAAILPRYSPLITVIYRYAAINRVARECGKWRQMAANGGKLPRYFPLLSVIFRFAAINRDEPSAAKLSAAAADFLQFVYLLFISARVY